MPRGGRRPGSGRKPKIRGPAHVLTHPSAPSGPLPPVEEFEPPESLSPAERAVWLMQAPHCFANGTLTRASALAFERYCRMVVMEADEAKSTGRGAAAHLRMVARVNDYELQFLLTANGKPLAVPKGEAAPAESKLARFRRT